MNLIVTVTIVALFLGAEGKSTKRSKDESAILNKKLTGKAVKPSPAIIAIEIVDPNENKTSSKNSKRTIDSSLGYGYSSYGRSSPPRYEVYKYSQNDIPAYANSGHNYFNGGGQYEIEKSLSYNLPSKQYNEPLNNYYQPGTTLFSTVNNEGQVGGLSNHLPQEPHVPVIILRVFPNQLNDPSASLHPNLPENHPLASAINSIDVQSLLSNYIQNLKHRQAPQDYQQNPQEYQAPPPQDYQHSAPEYQAPPPQDYQQYQADYHQQQQYVEQPQYQEQYQDGLLTHENYPKDSHTQVIFRTDKNEQEHSPPAKTIQVHLPAQSYSSVQVETPEMQYGYDSRNAQNYYQNNEGQQGEDSAQNYNYYYVPAEQGASSYQQPQSEEVVHQQPPPEAAPFNYHAHRKRSQKTSKVEGRVKDIEKLEPIRA